VSGHVPEAFLKATTNVMAKNRTSGAPGAARGGKFGQGRKPQTTAAATTVAEPVSSEPKVRFNLVDFIRSIPRFFQEVRAEARKITWPSRKETWITAVMVFIMLGITTMFFFVVDLIVGWGVGQVIKIGG
jgi:preprotein translocase subunit SecE